MDRNKRKETLLATLSLPETSRGIHADPARPAGSVPPGAAPRRRSCAQALLSHPGLFSFLLPFLGGPRALGRSAPHESPFHSPAAHRADPAADGERESSASVHGHRPGTVRQRLGGRV